MNKKTLELIQLYDVKSNIAKKWYVVKSLSNSTYYDIGQQLSESEVKDAIATKYNVKIVAK